MTRITASVDPDTLQMTASGERGEPILTSADPPFGSGRGIAPKHLVLVALAGCTASDVASILREKRQRVDAYDLVVTAESAQTHPKVFTAVDVEHRIRGDVTVEALTRSIELSATAYCPVNAMLSKVARVEHRYVLLDASGATHAATVAVSGPDH